MLRSGMSEEEAVQQFICIVRLMDKQDFDIVWMRNMKAMEETEDIIIHQDAERKIQKHR